MKNKTLIAIIIILVLIIIGLIVYFVFSQQTDKKGAKEETPTPSPKEEKIGEITSVHLEMFPAGTEMKPGLVGTTTTKFRRGDLMALSGEVVIYGVNAPTTLSFQILDAEGNMAAGGAPGMEIKGTGGFGMCCFNLPAEPGNYILKLFLKGKEAKTLPFEVLE